MVEDLRSAIQQLSESEAKSILLQMLIRLNMIQESHESPKKMIDDLLSWSQEIFQHTNAIEREYSTVHLVCGESPAGSLRVGLGSDQKVIGFPDFFAVGPIKDLHTATGRHRRYEWLKDHLNYQDDYLEKEYERRFLKTVAEICALPDQVPIVIWTADNADEQTGIRFLLYLLKEKANTIYLINTTLAYQEIFNTSEYQYFYHHTGEVMPEHLQLILPTKSVLTPNDRIQLENDWLKLTDTNEELRIWKNNEIVAVNEDYFDELLIDTARKFHAKQIQKDFIKSARIIGEVFGQIENTVGDAFLEYRLRTLIYTGVFEIKGIPKGMRYYSVRLKEEL